MNYLHRFEQWGESHHPRYMDIVRIALGVFLVYKGIDFLRNMGIMQDLMASSLTSGSFAIMLIGHYVVFAHITGGIFLAMGVLTRAACLIQIPILLGAVFFVNSSSEAFRPYSELIVSIIVLLLLIYFLMAGNGTLVVDMSEKEEKKECETCDEVGEITPLIHWQGEYLSYIPNELPGFDLKEAGNELENVFLIRVGITLLSVRYTQNLHYIN